MKPDPQHMHDKIALFFLCGGLLAILATVVVGVFMIRTIPSAGVGLLGTIVGGVISSFNNIIKMIQVSWEAVQWGKMTDSLAASGPAKDPKNPQPVKIVPDPEAEPQEVKVVNPPEEPVPTTTETKDE